MTRRIILFAAVLLLAGCFKDVSFETTYVLKPLQQQTSDDKNPPVIPGAAAFAFDADTATWTVVSYDDAVAGVITSKRGPFKTQGAVAASEPYVREGIEGWLRMTLDRESQMVVAVDPVNRLYAYTQQELGENLGTLYVSVVFQPWKKGFSYKNGNWSFYNDFYTPPVFLECFLAPGAQEVENGPETTIEKLTAYAYDADTTAWRIASYEDAVSGVITEKNGSKTRTNPDFKAYPVVDSDLYSMEVSSPVLMVVVVDQTHRMYAYTKKEVQLDGASPTFPVLFRVWLKERISVEDGWVTVNDKVESPEEESQSANKR